MQVSGILFCVLLWSYLHGMEHWTNGAYFLVDQVNQKSSNKFNGAAPFYYLNRFFFLKQDIIENSKCFLYIPFNLFETFVCLTILKENLKYIFTYNKVFIARLVLVSESSKKKMQMQNYPNFGKKTLICCILNKLVLHAMSL